MRQGAWAVIGLMAMAVAIRIDYGITSARACWCASRRDISAARRRAFLPRGKRDAQVDQVRRYVSLQPSEISKLALVAFLAFFLERRSDEIESFKRVFIPAGAGRRDNDRAGRGGAGPGHGAGSRRCLYGDDVSCGRARRAISPRWPCPRCRRSSYMLCCALAVQAAYGLPRPVEESDGTGFQVVQSLIAIGSGGLSGSGFAQGKQKLFYLPAPHTDFIFAVIGEELGLIGAATVVVLFGLLAWRGFRAARFAPDMFGQLLAIGITVMIIVQALFNVSVTLSLVPAKGIPLPFISSGGSSLAISLFAAGVLLNVSKHARTGQS